ncbi:MAG TPA: hypothetical protein VHE37_12455 [Nevskiaceae bacterium]|nr:hypothetical protein [Nevskiaceae bacterium]
MRPVKKIVLVLCLGLLSACSQQNNGDAGLTQSKAGVFSLFDPTAASPTIPFPFDGLFAGFTTPTLNIPNAGNVPFVNDANKQDGFSTTASIFTDFIGFVDMSSLFAAPPALSGLIVIDSSTHAPLIPGVDYTVQPSNAIDSSGHPISAYRTRLLIEPLKPLKPSTTYVVAITSALKSADGVPATPSDIFNVAASGTAVSAQTAPILATLNDTQKATLEALRAQLIHPTVAALVAAGIPQQAIVLAWPFTTESVGKTLTAVNTNAAAASLAVLSTGLSTLQASQGRAPDGGTVFLGTITVPYYLSAPSVADPTAALTGFWQADTAHPDNAAVFLGQVPCPAFDPSSPGHVAAFSPGASTTTCFPRPLKQSDQKIPVLVTVPNAASGQTMPTAGWPVVIFQHGITGDRSQMLGIAPTLAKAGFVTVAIDLPLHGITDTTSPLYRNQAFATAAPGFTTGERTFDLDLSNNGTGAPGPDGSIDGSGTYFINLSSLITSRDNLRQAVADLIVLTKSVPGTVFLAGGAPTADKIDGSRIYFVGHSLGGIVGSTLLGVNSNIRAATLAMPGGGIAKLLDASKAFGPRISAGLAAKGVIEGTDDYETFMRFAQTLTDSGDPINFAAAARGGHAIHMIEVVGSSTTPPDLVVPNHALANDGTGAYDKVTLTGFLSGTDPLYQQMGLATASTDPLSVPIAAQPLLTGASLGVVVQFAQGNHGSILDPSGGATNAAVTCEMQRETAAFLLSDGKALPLGGACP